MKMWSLASCHCRSPWWRSDWWHPLASEDVYITLVQGCCIQMDPGHPLSVRDTAVGEVPSSLLLLSHSANKSFTRHIGWCRLSGKEGFFCQCTRFSRRKCAPECAFLTSRQSFVIFFYLERGQLMFSTIFWGSGTWESKRIRVKRWRIRYKKWLLFLKSGAGEVLQCLFFLQGQGASEVLVIDFFFKIPFFT